MDTLEGIRIVDVDAGLTDTFLEYARSFGPTHDDSYVVPDELAEFIPGAEPAVLAFHGGSAPVGAAAVMLNGYASKGLARFRILHALDPTAYPLLIEALLVRLPESIERAFVFLPEHPGVITDALASAGFTESRRAYIMLHPSPIAVTEPELPGETILTAALPTAANDWAHVVNAAFRGYPGRYDMTSERAAELLGRPRLIKAGTLIAYRGGTPAGVVMTVTDEDKPFETEIETLAVLPAHQHIGLGRALLQSALLASGRDGRSSVILSVNTFNKRAMVMCLNLGFSVHNVRVCWEIRRA